MVSDYTATIDEAEAGWPGRSADAKRLRWFEVSLVLFVACGTPFLNSLHVLRNGPSAMPLMSNARWSNGIVQEVTSLLLLAYVLSRRNLRFKDLQFSYHLYYGWESTSPRAPPPEARLVSHCWGSSPWPRNTVRRHWKMPALRPWRSVYRSIASCAVVSSAARN
jgi:hypothetical protein